MRLIVFFISLLIGLCVHAGPHTIQKGETFADVAKLYKVSLDSVIKANPNTNAYVGLTIEVPLSTLVYDLGESELFRRMRYHSEAHNKKKGITKYIKAHEKQLNLKKVSGKNRQKIEAEIINAYVEAVSYGNADALYQLGRFKVHGALYSYDGYPKFTESVNPNLDEFKNGIEYLQIAALVGRNDKALVELALACGYEKSPIRNPYLCLGMLEQYQKELGIDVNHLICYMYENGYGIRPDLLQAYIYCPSTELTSKGKNKTHREIILEQIEAMPANFESARYGVGLDSKTMMAVGLSHFHDNVMEPEGIFWLHRAARQNNADANWALASIIQNENHTKEAVGKSRHKDEQILYFVRAAAINGKQEAEEYLEKYQELQRAKEQREKLRRQELQRQAEEKKQRRRAMWADLATTLVQSAAQTYMAVESAKIQSHQNQGATSFSTQRMPIGQMSDAQWQARNQLAMEQIAQYTMNKTYADWTGTPMIPTDMSAVDLGTDMSPGSPLWNWGMQQQINTIATQNARMSCEISAYYKRQADQITQQLIENPLQPIPGYVDIDGNWISREMVSGSMDWKQTDGETTPNRYSGFEEIRKKNREYYADRYGYKRCPICHGSGSCPICNGKGYSSNIFGSDGVHECTNCLKINGRPTVMCGHCQGTGHVNGLK